MYEGDIDEDDPIKAEERGYRRGFQQGAWTTYEGCVPYLPEAVRDELSDWVSFDLYQWRCNRLINAIPQAIATYVRQENRLRAYCCSEIVF
jgi:hypothetical protein